MKAWLVTWKWGNDAAAVVDVIATVLSPQLGEETVASVVELMYANATSNVEELCGIAKRPSANPYRARLDKGRIICGHNPYLWARKVSDLKVNRDPETDFEIVTWTEHGAILTPDQPGDPIKRGADRRAVVVRRRDGPLSHAAAWDRAEGGFIEGWAGFKGVIYVPVERSVDAE